MKTKTIKMLLALVLAVPTQMFAQQATISADEFALSVIPGIFTSDSAPKIHDAVDKYSFEEGDNNTINVYNDELESIATITYNPVQYKRSQSEELINGTDWVVYNEYYDYVAWITLRFLDLRNGAVLGDVSDTLLTQTLFNSDEKFEYILPKYRFVEEVEEYDETGDNKADVRYIYNRIYTSGIEVVSQDGNVVYSFDFGKEYEDEIDIKVVLWGDKTYLCVGNEKIYGTCDMYLLNRESSNVSLVKTKELKALKLFPSVAKKDSMVTIDLGDKTADNGGVIFVTDVNGRTMYTKRVEAGETSLKLPINGLASGLYVVSLRTPENSFEAAKLVVK